MNKNQRHSKTKGYQKEEKVCEYLMKRGWRIVLKNKKILGVEIDILAQKKKEKIIVEVKSVSSPNHIERILKLQQRERLKKVSESLSDDSIQLFLATVDPKNRIDFFTLS